MKTKKDEKQKQLTAKKILQKIREENKTLFAEIADFVTLLQEFGVTSYKLTGSVQDPIITNYSIS